MLLSYPWPYMNLHKPLFGKCSLVLPWFRPGVQMYKVYTSTINYWIEEWSEPYTGRWKFLSPVRAQNTFVGPGFWSTEIPHKCVCVCVRERLSWTIMEQPLRIAISFSAGEPPTVSNFYYPHGCHKGTSDGLLPRMWKFFHCMELAFFKVALLVKMVRVKAKIQSSNSNCATKIGD